jgi:hypothetical protein
MVRLVLLFTMSLLVCGPAFADEWGDAARLIPPWWIHWAITLLGLIVASRLALAAFGRAVAVADVPTFPRYMTSRQQYRLGVWAFLLFACAFFLLLIQENREVIPLIPEGVLPESVRKAAESQSPNYLAIVAAMGGVYLYLLTKEADWNVLLMMRDVVHSWISVPHLAKQIIAQIRFSLRVPGDAIPRVITASSALVESDFHKDPATPDRIWAEICYMNWWLEQGQEAGDDATFFTEESFGFDKLTDDRLEASKTMIRLKSGETTDVNMSDFIKIIKGLHNRFSRLVACYLIYRNGSWKDLRSEANRFGVEVSAPVLDNPLRYWIVYIIALIFSVYFGVWVSAVAYDAFNNHVLDLAQDPGRLKAWVMYSLCNYGLAIIVVLLLRMIVNSFESDFRQSHLITYCWTFLVSFVVGPIGLTVVVHFFGQGELRSITLVDLYYRMLMWGLGPALVSVYISYYLDRQTCSDLPDIDNSAGTIGWRLLNCAGFAVATIFMLLPSLLSLTSSEGATWESSKLRFVATGTTFCVTLGLALAAQFALRKQSRPPGAAVTTGLTR